MKKLKNTDWELILTAILSLVIAYIPFYLVYKIFSGIFYLLNKLIDKI